MATPSKINRDYIDPAYLTSLARRALADFEVNSPSSLAAYLPSQEVPDIEYEIEKGQDGLVTAANWRMFGGNTTSETWGQADRARGRMMPLARNFVLDEETLLRQRNDSGDAIARRASTLTERAAKAIALQVNLQRGNALANGKIQISGSGGLRQEVDFGRRADFSTTATELWTDPASDPIEYLSTLAEVYEQENGFRPEKMIVSTKVKAALLKNPQVVSYAYGDSDNTKPRATPGQLSALFAELDLPTIDTVGRGKVQVDDLDSATGETKVVDLLPQDSIIFVPAAGDPTAPDSSEFGRTLWGQTLSADLPDFQMKSGDLPGIVAAVINEGWPANMQVIADAIAMPVVYNPNYTLRAKVI